jgi:hypothetical protein
MIEKIFNQNQKGGSAMTECRYEKDVREYCDHGTLGNVSVRSFSYSDVYGDEDLAKIIDNLPALEHAMLIEEPCDCWERYGGPMHNDGGNYHSRIRIYEITPCVYLAVYGDTREAFSVDEFKYMVVWVEDQPVGLVVAKTHDCCHLLKREELEGFVKGYEEEGYSIYNCETN